MNKQNFLYKMLIFIGCLYSLYCFNPQKSIAQAYQPNSVLAQNNFHSADALTTYSSSNALEAGHLFFAQLSGNLANLVERIYGYFGKPTAYIIGEESALSFLGGVTYGEGKLYFPDSSEYKVFWQGASFGLDAGLQGSRVMMLVYKLDNIDSFWGRYGGFSGNAYLVSGLGLTALYHKKVLIIPVRTGIGARLGINFNYLKFTSAPTWNPF